ncbi:putative arabinan endo-1,5-alpha-L-arabinosidase A [Ascobolus immersus RN42]|uniref:Arabinan endo-1,5-alpha-L-arabinosidase n=1 Tax=Ascobolus immersus RN42 TaxID=1160509 RepID=A0A3N4ITW7_ASCIM|nr:putative arabinan endo-1,5-alpha-L-arabinosidase A [Ascobolus immersus RN42]
MKLQSFLLLLVSIITQTHAQYPSPQPCTGACGTHDPTIIRRASDGLYFRFATNGYINTATSWSLSGPWTDRGPAVNRPPSMNYGTDYWAPDVHNINGLYHLYYSISTFSSQSSGIGLLTSPTLDPLSWTDHGSIALDSRPGSPYNTIDANLIQAADGRYYMNFGSFWSNLYQAPMSSDLKRASGTPRQIAFEPTPPQPLEGGYMFREGGWYYLFFSKGRCCGLDVDPPGWGEEYKIMVCRSGVVDRGFVDRSGRSCLSGGGEVVLQSFGNVYAPGGQGVYRDPSMGPVLYYHYKNWNIGIRDGDAQFGWNRLDFSSGWPVVR